MRRTTIGRPGAFKEIRFSIIFLFFFIFSLLNNRLIQGAPQAYSGQTPSDALSSFNTDASALYSGQYTQAFPLYTLGTQNGPEVSLTLSYSSNVKRYVDLTNRDAQVSWVGLGFSLGGEAIFVNHNYTTDIADDQYYYAGSGGVVELYLVNGNIFRTKDNQSLYFTRVVDSLNHYLQVKYWVMKNQDGTRYIFGDSAFYPTVRNATRYINNWGAIVGIGASSGDALVPYQWDLRRIQSLDTKSYIQYSYKQELDSLKIVGGYADNDYTRSSTPDSIVSSSSEKIMLKTGSRLDHESFTANSRPEYFSTKRLEQIIFVGRGGDTLSRAYLNYGDYLNNSLDSTRKKLLLKSLTVKSGSNSDSLASTQFIYDTAGAAINRGSIREIIFPTGAHQKLVFKLLSDTANLTSLNKVLNQGDTNVYVSDPAISRNEMLLSYKRHGDAYYRFRIGLWNGYWKIADLPESTTIIPSRNEHGRTYAVSDGWAVLYLPSKNKIQVYEDRGGVWDKQEWAPSWTHSSGEYIVQAASNYFLIFNVVWDGTGHYYKVNWARFFVKKQNGQWKEHLIFTQSSAWPMFQSIQPGNDIYAIVIQDPSDTDKRKLYYGGYDFSADSLLKYSVNDAWNPTNLKAALGVGYVLFLARTTADSSYFCAATFNGHTWDKDTIRIYGTSQGFTPFQVGPVIHSSHYLYDKRLYCCARSSNGFEMNNPYVSVSSLTFLSTGENILATKMALEDSVKLFWWDGGGIESVDFLPSTDTWVSAVVSNEACVAYNGSNNGLYAKRYLGNNTWDDTKLLETKERLSFDASRDLVVSTQSYCKHGPPNDPDSGFISRKAYLWEGEKWDTVNLSSYSPVDSDVVPLVYSDRFYIKSNDKFLCDHEYAPSDEVASFQRINNTVTGKPALIVVDKIEIYRSEDTTHGEIQKFDYLGGILDPGAYTPRFAKVIASTPYFTGDDPDGYSITRFYNDLDTTQSITGLAFPNLTDSTRYGGTKDGGYYFDGLEYLSIDSSATDTAHTCFDSTVNSYSLLKFSYGLPRVLLSTTHTRQDKIAKETDFTYDDIGRIVKKTQPLFDGIVQVDTTEYALLPDNQLDRPCWELSFLTQSTDTQWTDRKLSCWNYDGTLRESKFWGDASPHTAHEEYSIDNVDGSDYLQGTHVLKVQAHGTGTCHYYMDALSDTTAVYALIHLKVGAGSWVKIDSVWPRTGGGILVDSLKYGEFSGFDAGDSIKATIVTPFGPSQLSVVQISLSLDFYPSSIANSEVVTFHEMPESMNFGRDQYNHNICWTGVDGDTSSAKYSPNGAYQIASIQNGFSGDCFFFNAENNFGADSVGYDGWRIWDLTYGTLTTGRSFTGKRCLKIADKPLTTAINSLSRKIDCDSLTRNWYVLSFWYYDSTGTGPSTTVTAYVSGSPTTILSKTYTTVNAWTRAFEMLDLSSYRGYDSIVLVVGRTGAENNRRSYVDDIRFHPLDAVVSTSTIDSAKGLALSRSGNDNIPIKFEYDSLQRLTKTYNFKGDVLDEKEFYFSSTDASHSGLYKDSKPNYIKVTTHKDFSIAPSAISYFDGAGRGIETRSQLYYDGAVKTMVTGFTTYNSKGQPVRVYKPFVDYSGSTGLTDFSDSGTMVSEVNTFYDGSHGQPNCSSYPYNENLYKDGVKPRLWKTAGAGTTYNMSSAKINEFDFETKVLGSDTFAVSTATDPDNISTAEVAKSDGSLKRSVSYYHRVGGASDSISVLTTIDPMTQNSITTIDSGGNTSITLHKTYTNDRGLADSTWKVDYGKTRMHYDRNGNPRFVMNEKRKSENKFVYFKYDALGRKIEEGILSDTAYFNDSVALVRDFPDTSLHPKIAYKWTYDYYSSGGNTSFAPGKLVRVCDSSESYERIFYYHPITFSDSVVVKLPTILNKKKIKHVYNRDGSLQAVTIYPKNSSGTGARTFSYGYDATGRLEKIYNNLVGVGLPSVKYAVYSYNPDGSIKRILYDTYLCSSGCPRTGDDTLQCIDYAYDALGRLVSINDTSSIATSLTGINSGNDHFGSVIKYESVSPNYYNGRVTAATSVYSASSDTVRHPFRYTYNDLGWLTYAVDTMASHYNQAFSYNALGQRTQMIMNGTTITYKYDLTIPGSSRLLWFTGMGTGVHDTMTYDVLGNLTSDSTRYLYSMTYDYRNMMTQTIMASTISGGSNSELDCQYDETGNRIYKYYKYQYWTTCGGGGGEEDFMGGGGEDDISDSTGGGAQTNSEDQCPAWGSATTAYLYDGGMLVATFNYSDSVIDLFINGPNGRIATFANNSNSYLYYYLTDHLGSTRALMQGTSDSGVAWQEIEYHTFYPYGEDLESWGSNQKPYLFTGKERDQANTFEFDYFGARYYDSRIGAFSSVDAAAQFASGYAYGGNNPVMVVDPDGNFAFFAIFALALKAYAAYNVVKAVVHGDAVGAALGVAGLIGLPSGIPNPYKGTNLVYSAASGGITSAVNSALTRMMVTDPFGDPTKGMGSAFKTGAALGLAQGLGRQQAKRQANHEAKLAASSAALRRSGLDFSSSNSSSSSSGGGPMIASSGWVPMDASRTAQLNIPTTLPSDYHLRAFAHYLAGGGDVTVSIDVLPQLYELEPTDFPGVQNAIEKGDVGSSHVTDIKNLEIDRKRYFPAWATFGHINAKVDGWLNLTKDSWSFVGTMSVTPDHYDFPAGNRDFFGEQITRFGREVGALTPTSRPFNFYFVDQIFLSGTGKR